MLDDAFKLTLDLIFPSENSNSLASYVFCV